MVVWGVCGDHCLTYVTEENYTHTTRIFENKTYTRRRCKAARAKFEIWITGRAGATTAVVLVCCGELFAF